MYVYIYICMYTYTSTYNSSAYTEGSEPPYVRTLALSKAMPAMSSEASDGSRPKRNMTRPLRNHRGT